MICLFQIPQEQICSIENLRKIHEVIAELKVLGYQYTNKKLVSLTEILKLSENYKTSLSTTNKLCRLVITSKYSTSKYRF